VLDPLPATPSTPETPQTTLTSEFMGGKEDITDNFGGKDDITDNNMDSNHNMDKVNFNFSFSKVNSL